MSSTQADINVEGMSRAQADIYLDLWMIFSEDVVLLQETHCTVEIQIQNRCKLPGYQQSYTVCIFLITNSGWWRGDQMNANLYWLMNLRK